MDAETRLSNTHAALKAISKIIDLYAMEPETLRYPIATIYMETDSRRITVVTVLDGTEERKRTIDLLREYFTEGKAQQTVEHIKACSLCQGKGFYLINHQKVECKACNGKGTKSEIEGHGS